MVTFGPKTEAKSAALVMSNKAKWKIPGSAVWEMNEMAGFV